MFGFFNVENFTYIQQSLSAQNRKGIPQIAFNKGDYSSNFEWMFPKY